jgi:hypothetical protein
MIAPSFFGPGLDHLQLALRALEPRAEVAHYRVGSAAGALRRAAVPQRDEQAALLGHHPRQVGVAGGALLACEGFAADLRVGRRGELGAGDEPMLQQPRHLHGRLGIEVLQVGGELHRQRRIDGNARLEREARDEQVGALRHAHEHADLRPERAFAQVGQHPGHLRGELGDAG